MKFKLIREHGETVQCDSCNFPAPLSAFDWGPPWTQEHDRPQRLLCEFCSLTMASRHTEHKRHAGEFERQRAETWKAAACVYNMLKHGDPDKR